MGIDTPRPALDISAISKELSRYWRVSVVEVTGSTQDDLVKKVDGSLARAGDVITAEFQSAGRGRLDRTFEADASMGLLFSLYIEPTREKSEWSFITLLTGLAAIFTFKRIDPSFSPQLKWPNDILIGDKKVGGIIATLAGHGVVIGCGINVDMPAERLPVETATSLSLCGFKELNRNQLLSDFLNIFEEMQKRWEDGEDLRHLYREYSATIGSHVRIELPGGGHREGRAVDISPIGELILEDGYRVTVGDVLHLR